MTPMMLLAMLLALVGSCSLIVSGSRAGESEGFLLVVLGWLTVWGAVWVAYGA